MATLSEPKLAANPLHPNVKHVKLTTEPVELNGTLRLPEEEVKENKNLNETVRVPVPSEDPDDPLNWNKSVKIGALISVCFFAFLANVNANCLVPALVGLEKEFHVTPQNASLVVSLSILMLGFGNLFWIPFMRKFGRRTMFLSASSVLLVVNIASPFAKSFGGLLAARLVANFCAGSADAAVPAFVADVFFLYERGRYMMVFHIFLSAAFFLGPLITGWIVASGGWRWAIGFVGIAVWVDLLLIFFLFRETTYDRDYSRSGPFPQRSRRQWLGLNLGYRREVNPFHVLYRIVRLAAYPPVLWAAFYVGVVSGATVTLQLASASLLVRPPYKFAPGEVGSFQVSGFIGALVGFFLGGRLIDYIAAVSTRRNRGLWEPEMRLIALFFPGICGPSAMLIAGLCFRYKTPWIAPAVGNALLGLTITCVNNICVTYAVDSYLPVAGEVVTIVFVIRNTISCILSVYSITWIKNVGVAQSLNTMGAIMFGFAASSIVMYYYGKRLRQLTTRYGVLKELAKH